MWAMNSTFGDSPGCGASITALPVIGIRKSSMQSHWSFPIDGSCEVDNAFVSWSQECIHKRSPNFWVNTRIKARASMRTFNLRMF